MVNAVHGQGLRALSRLALRAGRPGLAAWADEQAGRVTDALLERCFDERRGMFFNLVGRDERRGRVKTVQGLVPLVLPDLPREVVDR